jgi:hypothetical protein
MNSRTWLVSLAWAAALPAEAGQADLGPVYLERVAIINQAFGGHQSGNVELKILNGFTVPSTVSCDSSYLTTLKTADPDKKVFAIAMTAQALKAPVYMRITDDAALTAFSGRCSVMAINIAQ